MFDYWKRELLDTDLDLGEIKRVALERESPPLIDPPLALRGGTSVLGAEDEDEDEEEEEGGDEERRGRGEE